MLRAKYEAYILYILQKRFKVSKIHLQERCKMEMLYAISDAATGPLIETDHIFGIVVADSQEVAHDLLTADP